MKIATIGSGFIVDHFIQAGRLVKGVEFVACYSRTIDRAIEFAKKHNIDRKFDSIELMLSNQDIDTIYVASPNSLHYEQTMQAIRAGKHVIVEKPFAGNRQRAQEMFDEAKKHNVYIFEAITTIHLPHFESFKNSIEEIQPVTVVQANFSQYSSRYDSLLKGENPNVFNPDFSGGALADINVYNIHFMLGLFGKPRRMNYFARRYKNEVDVSGILTFEYPDFVASLVGSKDSASANFVMVQGEHGVITSPSSSSMLSKLQIETKNGSSEINIQDGPQHMYQIEVFESIIKNKDDQEYTRLMNHTLDVVEVLEEARSQIGMFYKY